MKKVKVILFVLTCIFCIGLSISQNNASAASLSVRSLSTSCGSSTTTGKTIKISASASGGSGTKKYSFKYKLNNKMYTIKRYSTSRTVSFKPTKAGTYRFYVYVKDRKRTVYRSKTVKVTTPYTVSLSTSGKYINQNVKLTASSTGGSGTKKYKFTYKYNGKTYTIKNYSTTKTVYYKPTKTGTYTFYVTVKDSKGKTKITSRSVSIVYPTLKLDSFTTSYTSSLSLKPITLKTTSSGNYGTLYTRFSYILNGNTTVIKDFSTSKSCSFTPKEYGNYTFITEIKDSRNKIIKKTMSVDIQDLVLYEFGEEVVGTTKKIMKDVAKGATVTYSTSRVNVCQIDHSYNLLMPISQGTANIKVTAKLNGETVSKTVEVNVTGNENILIGCDISKWNGYIDASLLKKSGIDYAIMRIGYSTRSSGVLKLHQDEKFETNIKNIKNNHLGFGLYWYSKATTVAEAQKEADTLWTYMNNNRLSIGQDGFDYCIYYDLEDSVIANLSMTKIKEITQAFTERLVAKGIPVEKISIYANKNWYENHLDNTYYQLFADRLWYARYGYAGTQPTFYWNCNQTTMKPCMWQVGSGFQIQGTNYDLNYYYQ